MGERVRISNIQTAMLAITSLTIIGHFDSANFGS